MDNIGVGDFKTTPRMRDYINQVLDSDQISYGSLSKQFEQEVARLHNCKYGILSNSGTSSLLVALQTLKEVHNWQNGDEVIVPALTFVATVNVVLQCGLKPVPVDVEKDYYGINPNEMVISNKTRAIIPVHTFGQPCDMIGLDLMLIGQAYAHGFDNILIIEDSCESMFVNYCDRPIGSWGNIACFSFYNAHLLTCGVGGMSTTNNLEYAKVMRSLVNHGMDNNDLEPMALNRDFNFSRIGHSFRLTEFEAALGLAGLETWQGMIEARQNNARYLSGNLQDLQDRLQLPTTRPNTEHAFMMYPIVCLQDNTRDNLCRYLNERGIGTRRMLPLINQFCYRGLWNPGDYPVAQWINANGFYIGCHQYLTRKDLNYVSETIGEYFF